MDSKISKELHKLWNENKLLEAGKIVYESLPNNSRPLWASDILTECVKLINPVSEFLLVIRTAKTPNEWKNAHKVFQEVRNLTLKDEKNIGKNFVYTGLLSLAENTAKVTYNSFCANLAIDYQYSSEFLPPFDEDSGLWIVQNLKYILEQVKDSNFEKRALKVAFEFEIND